MRDALNRVQLETCSASLGRREGEDLNRNLRVSNWTRFRPAAAHLQVTPDRPDNDALQERGRQTTSRSQAARPPDDPAQHRDQAEPRHQGQKGLRDMATSSQHGSDDWFGDGEPRGPRAGLHDLADPSAKGRREAGLVGRFQGVCGRWV